MPAYGSTRNHLKNYIYLYTSSLIGDLQPFTMASPISSNKSRLAKLALLLIAQHVNAGPLPRDAAIALPKTIDNSNKAPLSDSFLSYSIEFAFFPDFAGKRLALPHAQS
jgi:hypothetical protein